MWTSGFDGTAGLERPRGEGGMGRGACSQPTRGQKDYMCVQYVFERGWREGQEPYQLKPALCYCSAPELSIIVLWANGSTGRIPGFKQWDQTDGKATRLRSEGRLLRKNAVFKAMELVLCHV